MPQITEKKTKDKEEAKKAGRPTKESLSPKAKENEKIICLNCGSKNQSNFYQSHSRFNKYFGYIPYCKDCIKGEMYEYYLKKYNHNEQLAIHGLVRSINVPYIHSIYLASIKNINNPNAKINNLDEDNIKEGILVSAYFKNYNSLHDSNNYGDTYLDSEGLGEIQGLSEYEDIIKIRRRQRINDSKNIDTEKYDVIEYDAEELVLKWGDFDDEDLIYLENEYLDWKDKLGDYIEEKSTQLMVMQVCLQTAEIYKKRQNGDKVKDELASLQALLNNSGLLEKQKIKSMESIQIGMSIKDIENRRPLKDIDPMLKDVDKYKELLYTYLGALSRTLGKENFYTKKFDEVYEDSTIELIKTKTSVSEENEEEDTYGIS